MEKRNHPSREMGPCGDNARRDPKRLRKNKKFNDQRLRWMRLWTYEEGN